MNTTDPIIFSVVVPCFNEQEVIPQTHQRLTEQLNVMDKRYEIIYIDDGSSDDTPRLLAELAEGDERARVIRFTRNFGHQYAITAGLEYATGQAVVIIDADLQDPPELIAAMVERWREGYHVVYGQRIDREGETKFKLWTARAFYKFINWLSDVHIPADTGDFRLMDRKVVDAFLRLPERDRFVRGMVAWVGFNQVALPYHREARAAGASKYPLGKMVRFALDGVLSFSLIPLRLAALAGILVSGLSLLGILYALVCRLFTNIWVPGWTLLFITLLFLGGIQLLFMGLLGEYIGRIFTEAKRRPKYLVLETHGFGDPTPTGGGYHAG